ncbi:MAG: hypothetical protein MK171_06810 [Pirellulales bacterium]|nr:hypothetical protein [Pirellulales bacterium]
MDRSGNRKAECHSARLPTRLPAPWRLADDVAVLKTGALSATLRVGDPGQGLGELAWNGGAVGGRILGVTTHSAPLATGRSRPTAFTRGDDLVASYSVDPQQPTSCQIYWRATPQANGSVVVDTIVSVQTDLLESFPEIVLETQLASEQLWLLRPDEARGQQDDRWHLAEQTTATGLDVGCLILRPERADWSYAEMTHPDDRDRWKVQRADSGQYVMQRRLGGSFLEKGVIRVMRIRGAFLPRADDLHLAEECFLALTAAAPPLTA